MIVALFQSFRVKQWTKNLLLFAGILFSQKILDPDLLLLAVLGFVSFCMLSSAEYLVNDLLDLEKDRAHPIKSLRPLPSGRLSVHTAIFAALLLFGGGLTLAFWLRTSFGTIALIYATLMLLYSFFLKHIVILDVIILASGFVIRAMAGAVVVDVVISSWLLICTIFLALFLGLCKRRYELVLLGDEAIEHRKILGEYSPYLLDQMISVVTAGAVMSYALYTMAQETIAKVGSRNLIFTVPFVIYSIFRYLYIVHHKKLGGSPELDLIQDKSMVINIFLYLLVVALIIYTK